VGGGLLGFWDGSSLPSRHKLHKKISVNVPQDRRIREKLLRMQFSLNGKWHINFTKDENTLHQKPGDR